MNMPRFTAENSFTKGGQYRLSGVIGGAKPNMVEPAQVCGPCGCTVRCYGTGIFRYCEFRCTQTCWYCADPIGCFRRTMPCSPFRW